MAKRLNTQQGEEIQVQILLDVKPDTPSYYANFIGVSHTAYDFTLSVCRIPNPLTEEQIEIAKSGKRIPVEPMLQLVLSPLVVDGLINALNDQRAKQELTQKGAKNDLQQHGKQANSIN